MIPSATTTTAAPAPASRAIWIWALLPLVLLAALIAAIVRLEPAERLRPEGMPPVERLKIDPEVDVPVASALPEDWIGDVGTRLDAYQRLALARNRAEVRRELESLESQYGPAPDLALNLCWLHEARIRCRELGIERLAVHKVRAVLRLHPTSPVAPAAIDALVRSAPNRFRKAGDRELEVRFSPEEGLLPFRLIDWICARIEHPPA